MLQLWFIANSLLWPFNIELAGMKLGLNVIVLTLVGAVWIGKKPRIAGYSAKVLLGFFIFLLFSYLAAITGTCTDKFHKFIFTAPLLFFLVLVGLEVGWRASDNDWLKLQKISIWVLLTAFAGFIIEVLLPASFPQQERYRLEGKLSGLFNEPSFVAYSLFPIVAILLVAESKPLRRKGALALLGLVFLSRSTTLMGLIMAWILYRLFVQRKLWHALFIALCLLFAVGLGVVVNYDLLVAPTVERVVGVTSVYETKNISSLVYVQGWQDAWTNLLRTNGLGLGFNMMGCTPFPDVPTRDILATFNLELNAEDGSFLFGKIVSEAGVIGILFIIAIICWWFRIEKNIRKYSSGAESTILSIQTTLMFSFVATSFLRSAGYFNGSILLLVVAVAATVKWQKARITRLSIAQSGKLKCE